MAEEIGVHTGPGCDICTLRDLLKASEARMGIKLVEAGPNEKSIQLTAQARAIIERFEKLERDVEILLQEANRDFKKLIRMVAK